MLLETLDVKKNDVLIYSKNEFDFNNNFKIIFKKDRIKQPKSISFFEVCEFIKEPIPKNLIIYRLLTNVNSLESSSTKYGYFIKIYGRLELVYFDPIFAIKDLRHLRFDLDPSEFRFKIQQIGLFSNKFERESDYEEIFAFDLRAIEAQHQNDKIYADAIFALDPDFIEEEVESLNFRDADKIDKEFGSRERLSSFEGINNVAEESGTDRENFSKPRMSVQSSNTDRERSISTLKGVLGIDRTSLENDEPIQPKKTSKTFSEFLNKYKSENQNTVDESSDRQDNIIDLFKSAGTKTKIEERVNENIILRFTKS